MPEVTMPVEFAQALEGFRQYLEADGNARVGFRNPFRIPKTSQSPTTLKR